MADTKLDKHLLKTLLELQKPVAVSPAILHMIEEQNKISELSRRSSSPLAASILESQKKMESVISQKMSQVMMDAAALSARATKQINELLSPHVASSLKQQSELFKLYEYHTSFNSGIASSLLKNNEEISRLFSGFAFPIAQPHGVFEQLVDRYHELVECSDPVPFETLTNEVIRDSEGKNHSEAFQAYIFPLLLFLLSILITTYQSGLTEEHANEHFDRLEEQGNRILTKLTSITRHEEFYYVKRAVHLRDSPDTKHNILLTLYPGTTVKLLDRASKWIEVEYYDYSSDTTTKGWVYKKYLKMIR